MSVPIFDVSTLWRMPCDDFNEWRATTDLPILYDYVLQRLPDFTIWATEFNVDRETFSRTSQDNTSNSGRLSWNLMSMRVDASLTGILSQT